MGLVARTPRQLSREQGVEVRLRHRVLSIEPDAKRLKVLDLEDGVEREEPYDRLVLATGAHPFVPPLPGREAEGVFTMRTLADALEMEGFIKRRRPRRAAVIGAGSVGLEMCEALAALGMRVSLVEMAPQVMPQLDADLAERVRGHLESRGVEVRCGERVLEITAGRGQVAGLLTETGEAAADLVLLSIGIRPTATLAEEAGLALGAGGAVRVDERMRTSREDIYAAGDCCTVTNLVSGAEAWMPLGSTSRKQGRVAGANAAGGEEAFRGVVGTGILKVFDLTVGGTGLSGAAAEAAGFRVVTVELEDHSRPRYYGGGGDARFRLTADRDTGRLLGAQVVGETASNADKRLDVFAACIQARMTAGDLEGLDLAYAPPFSQATDLPIVAGSLLGRALRD